ncbi:MAG: FGGY family carbohydrate kinase, partial [Candidatus Sulfotelmatobacter sp.]
MNYLGIDVGTGGTRALVIDSLGSIVASASAEHENFASPRPGWAEQDPHDWWKACGLAVRKALQTSGQRPEDIACVGFSGQMHGAVLLDSADEVVRPAIIWCDQRSEAQSRELEQMFGRDTLIR